MFSYFRKIRAQVGRITDYTGWNQAEMLTDCGAFHRRGRRVEGGRHWPCLWGKASGRVLCTGFNLGR